jgi:serine phosphatase RsbU (regulator of sigma subunit)
LLNVGGEEFGEMRLEALVKNHSGLSAIGLRDLILKEITQFVGESGPHDDLTLVVAKVT